MAPLTAAQLNVTCLSPAVAVFRTGAAGTDVDATGAALTSLEYTLSPLALYETSLDRAPQNKGKHEKLIYVVSGKLACMIDSEEILLKGGDTISFNSVKPHRFKNAAKAKCKFIAVENPGRY